MNHVVKKIKRPFFRQWLKEKDLEKEFTQAVSESVYSQKIGDLVVCWIWDKFYHAKDSLNAAHNLDMTRRMCLRDVSINDSDVWWRNQKRKHVFYDFIKQSIQNGEFFKSEFKESYYYKRIMDSKNPLPTMKEVQVEIKDHAKAAANDKESSYQTPQNDLFKDAKNVNMF